MNDRTTVRLPVELKSQAMRKAAEEGRTLTSLIEEGLRHVVSGKADQSRPRVMPRVSQARGWLAPGIKDLRDAEELEDIEYVERLRRL
jgi:hypothetical protein